MQNPVSHILLRVHALLGYMKHTFKALGSKLGAKYTSGVGTPVEDMVAHVSILTVPQ